MRQSTLDPAEIAVLGHALAPTGPWVQQIAGCVSAQIKKRKQRVKQLLKNYDLRAQIWAYTPQTSKWDLVYQSPIMNLDTTMVRTASPQSSTSGGAEGATAQGSAVGSSSKFVCTTRSGTTIYSAYAPLMNSKSSQRFGRFRRQ